MTAPDPTALSTSRESLSALRELIDCPGSDIKVHTEDLLAILAVTGEIDAANVADLSAALDRFTASECRLVVDLRGIGFLSIQGLRALNRFDEKCC